MEDVCAYDYEYIMCGRVADDVCIDACIGISDDAKAVYCNIQPDVDCMQNMRTISMCISLFHV